MVVQERAALQLSPLAAKAVGGSFLLTGLARSGTTITGKLIHSFARVEYAFEPAQLFALMPLIETMAADQWRYLFESYLYEEYLMNSLAGRGLNCNRCDDSSIYRVKDEVTIASRLNRSWAKDETEKLAANSILVVKMPDIARYLMRLNTYYPKLRILVILRSFAEVALSTQAKSWFSDQSLRSSHRIWPYYQGETGIAIPYWVEREKQQWWQRASEIDRFAYYAIQYYQGLKQCQNITLLHYDDLIDATQQFAETLCNYLGTEFGPMTNSIIAQVKRISPKPSRDILVGMCPSLQKKLIELGALEAVGYE